MAETSVALDEIFEASIVTSTPVLAKASDRTLRYGVDSTVKFTAGNDVAKLRSRWGVRLTVDIEEEAATGDGRSCFVDEVGVVLISRDCVWDLKSCFIDLSVGIQFLPL